LTVGAAEAFVIIRTKNAASAEAAKAMESRTVRGTTRLPEGSNSPPGAIAVSLINVALQAGFKHLKPPIQRRKRVVEIPEYEVGVASRAPKILGVTGDTQGAWT
jgi:hypothetical protein